MNFIGLIRMRRMRFSSQHLSKEQSDTYDLNDPRALRKADAIRKGDDDPRCGAASMLKFGGEDLMKAERKRQQQKQQAMETDRNGSKSIEVHGKKAQRGRGIVFQKKEYITNSNRIL